MKLLLGFVVWNLLGWLVFPKYGQIVVAAAAAVLAWLQPQGVLVNLSNKYPHLFWSCSAPGHDAQSGFISIRLLLYNTVIYLAVLGAIPLTIKQRFVLLASGLPIVFIFHVFDLSMTIESRILSVTQAEHRDFLKDFGLWFSLVKFYNFFSVLAFKQASLVILLAMQWYLMHKIKKALSSLSNTL